MASHNLFAELRRRHIFRVAAAYAVTSWLLLQVAAILFPAFDAPDWAIRALFGVLVLGFPVALVVAWAYEITPEGLRRTRGGADDAHADVLQRARRVGVYLNVIIVAVLAAAVGVLGWRLAARPGGPVAERAAPAAAGAAVPTRLGAPDKSIAVLPFANLSADPDNAYFSAGIRDEILTKLANLQDIKVIAGASAQAYGAHPDDLASVARELGVATLLEGSVQKAGDEVLINVQLVDARTRQSVWAQSYDRTLANVFDVEGEVAEKVATALQAKLAPEQAARLAAAPTQNPEAYDWFLKGEYRFGRGWAGIGDPESEFDAAISDYRKAVAHDPGFALAWARLALAHLELYHWGRDRTPARLAKARAALDKALAIDPESPEVHLVEGYYEYWGYHDYSAGLAEFKRALAGAPQNASAYSAIAGVYRHLGDWRAATRADQQAIALDPRDSLAITWLGDDYYGLHRYAEAERQFERALAVDPSNVTAVESLVIAFGEAGDVAQALAVLDRVPREIRDDPIVLWNRAWVLMLQGHYAAAVAALHRIPAGGVSEYSLLLQLGLLERALGNRAQAHDHAGKAAGILKRALARDPDNPDLHLALGTAYAQLGRADAAVREGRRAVALDPVAHDAYGGPARLEGLAEIYAQLGRVHEAVALLERLLPMPGSNISVPLLERSPVWQPIRDDPAFRALLARGAGPAATAPPPVSATAARSGA